MKVTIVSIFPEGDIEVELDQEAVEMSTALAKNELGDTASEEDITYYIISLVKEALDKAWANTNNDQMDNIDVHKV